MKVRNVELTSGVLLAELAGTFVLALVALTVPNPIVVGFTLVVLVLAVGSISGAHLNPALSFGLWTVRKLKSVTLVAYWVAQLVGAYLALLVSQVYLGVSHSISFASFGSFDGKVFWAEVIGAAIFGFAVVAASDRELVDSSKAFLVGLGLLAGLAIGGGLLAQAATASSASATSRAAKVDGVVLNPAIALGVTEKSDAKSSSRPASRFTWEVVIGDLLGAAVGMNVLLLAAGTSPFVEKA